MAKHTKSGKTIRIGVVGVGRGEVFARGAGRDMGMELVALCDVDEARLAGLGKRLGVATYTEFAKMLEHDLDAVILANYFHQHAGLAVQALRAGKHVMSETTAAFTMAEAVELVEAVQASGRIYMFAENYPYMLFNQEMKRLYRVRCGRGVRLRRGRVRPPRHAGLHRHHLPRPATLAELDPGDVLLHALAGPADVHYGDLAGEGQRVRDAPPGRRPGHRRTARVSDAAS